MARVQPEEPAGVYADELEQAKMEVLRIAQDESLEAQSAKPALEEASPAGEASGSQDPHGQKASAPGRGAGQIGILHDMGE